MDQGEGDLLARLSTDLDPSFEGLMMTYWHQLYAFVLRRVESQQDAEDIVSEAFVRAYLALKGYPAERIRTLKLRPRLYKLPITSIVDLSADQRIHRRRLHSWKWGWSLNKRKIRGSSPSCFLRVQNAARN